MTPPTVHNGAEGFVPMGMSFFMPGKESAVQLKFLDISPDDGKAVDLIIDNVRMTKISPIPDIAGTKLLLIISMFTLILAYHLNKRDNYIPILSQNIKASPQH